MRKQLPKHGYFLISSKSLTVAPNFLILWILTDWIFNFMFAKRISLKLVLQKKKLKSKKWWFVCFDQIKGRLSRNWADKKIFLFQIRIQRTWISKNHLAWFLLPRGFAPCNKNNNFASSQLTKQLKFTVFLLPKQSIFQRRRPEKSVLENLVVWARGNNIFSYNLTCSAHCLPITSVF